MQTNVYQLPILLFIMLACWMSLPLRAQALTDAERFETLHYINPHEALPYYRRIFLETSPDRDLTLWLQAAVKLNSTSFHIGDLSEVPKVLAEVLEKAAQASDRASYAHLLLQHHIILANQGDHVQSETTLEKAFTEAKAASSPPILALVYLYRAKNAHRQGQKGEALSFLHQASGTLKETAHDARYYALLNNIGTLLNELNGHVGESLKIFAEITEYFDRHNLYFLASIAYENYASILVRDGQLDAALRSYDKSLHHARAIQDEYGIASAALGMGNVFQKQRRHREALQQYHLARRIFARFKDPAALARLDIARAQTFTALGRIEEAWRLVKNWKTYHETQTSPDSMAQLMELEARILEKMGRHEEAMQSYKSLSQLQQSIFDTKKQEIANRYYTEFEVERRNQEKIKLEHQNRLQSITIESQEKLAVRTHLALAGAVIAVGVLALSFHRAELSRRKIAGLQRYIETNVLQRFLPPELVQEILAGKSRLDDRTKTENVTVLFADLCQFTRATDKLGPETISHILNDFFINMSDVIFAERGTIDKFIGDAIMVIFGAPSSLPPDEQARAAVRCAQRMQEKLQELNQAWELSEGQHFEMRIGIHQGQAVVGTFGGARRSDYTVVGTSVNIAARVENIADPNSILVTEAITRFLDPQEFSLRGHYKLRGLDMELPLFRVEEQSSDARKLECAS